MDIIEQAYALHQQGLNYTEIGSELDIDRRTASKYIKEYSNQAFDHIETHSHKHPIVADLPIQGEVKRYFITSAQNNTKINDKAYQNIQAIASHYDAKLLVSTVPYIKRGISTNGNTVDRNNIQYDPKIVPHINNDRIKLSNDLIFCGDFHIIPTASNPLSGLQAVEGHISLIFPHPQKALKSIASTAELNQKYTKILYTTGSITDCNYIQNKTGKIAEFNHSIGGLLVEVDSQGHSYVRQLICAEDDDYSICDLDLYVKDGKIEKTEIEAFNPGDIHIHEMEEEHLNEIWNPAKGILTRLKPKYQFFHDLFDGHSISHHHLKDPFENYEKHHKKSNNLNDELSNTANFLAFSKRRDCISIVVESNHDATLIKYLRRQNPLLDYENALICSKLLTIMYLSINIHNCVNHVYDPLYQSIYDKVSEYVKEDKPFSILEFTLKEMHSVPSDILFNDVDSDFNVLGIGFNYHGDIGAHGSRGSVNQFANAPIKTNTGHTHTAAICKGAYVAGVTAGLYMGYNKGLTGWSISHILTYKNGKRSIITRKNKKYWL